MHDEGQSDECQYWDDMSGKQLNSEAVKQARAEEMAYVRSYNLYTKVPESEAWEVTGKAPIGTRWIDINKGSDSQPDHRSRLVAQEIKTDKRQELFAATPPFGSLEDVIVNGCHNWNRSECQR